MLIQEVRCLHAAVTIDAKMVSLLLSSGAEINAAELMVTYSCDPDMHELSLMQCARNDSL